MSGISWLHELSTLHSLEVKIRTCIQNIALWNQPICVPKTIFYQTLYPDENKMIFSKYIHVLDLSRKFIAQTRKKKNMHVFFYVSLVTCNIFNLSNICIWTLSQKASKFQVLMWNRFLKLQPVLPLIKNWYLLISFIKIQKIMIIINSTDVIITEKITFEILI